MGDEGIEIDPPYGGDTAVAHAAHASAFEGVDSAHWREVRDHARETVKGRLIVLTFAAQTGVRNFQRDADTMIDEYIKEPPRKPITGLGAIIEGLAAAGSILIPEATLAADIFETAKAVYEMYKPAAELQDKFREQVVARSVEEAKTKLKGLASELADAADNTAPMVLDQAFGTINTSLDAYITAHPHPLQDTDEYYGALSDVIGIKHWDPTDSAATVYNSMFPKFKFALMTATSTLHFFHELSNDFERLNFLMDEAERGNDPDALLVLIGADKPYWDRFLTVYRASGRDAAVAALMQHLTGFGG
jgi:hypothetical protein